MTTAPTPPPIRLISRRLIIPSGLNPRTYFDPIKLEELRSSINARGFDPAFPLLVRPKGDLFEIAAGERRWTVSENLVDELPCIVREISDRDLLEIALVENLQRDDLNPIEEANAYAKLLQLRDDAGNNVHTFDSLALKIGRTGKHVRDRVRLASLADTPVGAAVVSGEITPSHGELLTRIPSAAIRAEVLKKVLKPTYGPGPMPVEALRLMIVTDYQVQLRGAQFDLADATLVAEALDPVTQIRIAGGDCNTCPQNTRNAEEKGSKFHLCQNPECFRAKTAAAFEKWRAEVTNAEENRVALPAEENAALWDDSGERLRFDSSLVELNDQPGADELRAGLEEIPTWRRLVKGQPVRVILARDGRGKVRELVDHDSAVEAAKLNAFEIFREKGNRRADPAPAVPVPVSETVEDHTKRQAHSDEEEEKRVRKAAEVAELERRTKQATLVAIRDAAGALKRIGAAWILVLEPMVRAAECFGKLLEVGIVYGYAIEKHGREAATLRAYMLEQIRNTPAEKLHAIAVVLARACNVTEEDRTAWDKTAVKALDVNIREISKEVAQQMKREAEARALQEDLESGLTWDEQKTKASDFCWNEATGASNPDLCRVKLGKYKGEVALVAVALDDRGWRVGFSVGEKAGVSCAQSSTNYSNRALALRAGLLAIKLRIRDAKVKDEDDALERLKFYLSRIETPPEPPQKPAEREAPGRKMKRSNRGRSR